MSVAFVVPLDTTDPDRRAAWEYVRGTLVERHSSWSIVFGGSPEPWSKGAALAAARKQTCAEVLIVHDADVLVSAYALWAAVDAVSDGAAWAVPHREVFRLNAAATRRVLAGEQALDVRRTPEQYARAPYRGIQGGGITVVRADVWDDCPVDPRFTGWGGEDEAWGWALGCLYGPPWRGSAPLWHLWHPHPAPGARHATTPAGHLLWRAYRGKVRRPDLMRALVDQAR